MLDDWQQRAQDSRDRKAKLQSFGQHALGLIVGTPQGLFAVEAEDNSVSRALLEYGSYADGENELLTSLIAKESDILIVGAHIGVQAVRLSKLCRKLVATEANPHTYFYLQANLALNHCNNATAHLAAVSDKIETIRFVLSKENSGGSKREPRELHRHYIYDDPEIIEINTVVLDQFFAGQKFDVVLMSVAGSEYYALKGLQEILSTARLLAVQFFPCHIRDIAAVDPEQFASTISPHFEWMYVAKSHTLYNKNQIASKLRDFYDRDENHDLLYFMKDVSPAWLQQWRVDTEPSDPRSVHDETLTVLRYLRPHSAAGYKKARFGSAHDGGYVMLDDFRGQDIAFSFGIEQNAEWDAAIADRGLTVFQFDHTVDISNEDNPRLIFAKTKIAASVGEGAESLLSLLEKHDKRRKTPNIILKIDIENDEWDVFDATPVEALGRFSQIIGEFHSFENLSVHHWRQRALRVFEKITRNFYLVHVHANNHASYTNIENIIVPNVLELTFANKDLYEFVESREIFPTGLDAPCNRDRPDIHLGSFLY